MIDTTMFRPFGWDAFREKTGLLCHIVSDRYFNQSWLPTLNRTLAESIGFQLNQRRKPELNETLTSSELFIARDTILKLKDAIDTGEPMNSMINGGVVPSPPTEMNEGKPVRTTAKQAELIVALLKGIGLTDSDLSGSVSQLRARANNRVEGLPFPDDDKALIEWLRRGGINR